MARPQVADGGDGLQMWMVTANIVNKQLRAAKWWLPSLGLGAGLTTPHRTNKLLTKRHKGLQAWTDSLDERPKLRKMGMRFGT
jgi:hypothetical protein